MKIENHPHLSIDWGAVKGEKVPGERGYATIKSRMLGTIQVRSVEYSKDYLADHWCDKGHLVFVHEGEFILEHKDGETLHIKKGMSYLVGDDSSSHRAGSKTGAKVFIVD